MGARFGQQVDAVALDTELARKFPPPSMTDCDVS